MSSESERFVDEAEKPIPAKDTWEELTINELIDVKLQLEEKLWSFSKHPVITPVLKQAVKDITLMIASRSR